jgi:hypothetical protein
MAVFVTAIQSTNRLRIAESGLDARNGCGHDVRLKRLVAFCIDDQSLGLSSCQVRCDFTVGHSLAMML